MPLFVEVQLVANLCDKRLINSGERKDLKEIMLHYSKKNYGQIIG